MYVKENHRATKEDISNILATMNDGDDVSVELLVKIHHAYHWMDPDFDGGLSFLDKLHHKLTLYYDVAWDLDGIKSIIRESSKPEEEFYEILRQMLTADMIACYGV